ncbi:MAG: hypothetical protein NTX82_05650 [Candidatus Parcubacteria bacterium]|nr:hypothetical protein [Candidatus Parcubacteria bacterium]
MLGEFKAGECVVQLAMVHDLEVLPDGRIEIFVNDEHGQATRPLKISKKDFERQFRPWGGCQNVFVRLVKIVALEPNNMIRFQRLDINGKNIGDEQLSRKDIFAQVYLLEHQIVI